MAREMKKQERNPEDLITKERGTEVKITDEISLLNWIPHFAGQFLNKLKVSTQLWSEGSMELCWSPISNENKFVFAENGGVPQLDTSDLEWCLGIDEFGRLIGDPGHMMTRSHTMISQTKLARRQQINGDPRMEVDEEGHSWRRRNGIWATFCLRILKHADTWEVVRDMRCLLRREKRLDSESESERLSWREKTGGKYARTQSSPRAEKSSNWARCRGCSWGTRW